MSEFVRLHCCVHTCVCAHKSVCVCSAAMHVCVCVCVCAHNMGHILYKIGESLAEQERKENETSCFQMETEEVEKVSETEAQVLTLPWYIGEDTFVRKR